MLRRSIKAAAVGYVVLGLWSLGLERAGVLRCECQPGCWCKRPGLNVFRWVFPYGHQLAA
jgi:hypothetical protein